MRTRALGWSITAILLTGIIAVVVSVQWMLHATTPRTAFSKDSAHGAEIIWPAEPQLVVPVVSGDGSAIYQAALDMYLKNPAPYGQFIRGGKLIDLEDIPAIDLLVRAARCSTAILFRDQPKVLVNLNSEKPPLVALRTLGDCMIRAGLLQEQTRPADSMTLYEATFTLGARLYEERLTYAELDAGLTLMAKGSSSIARLAEMRGDGARAAAARQFDDARKQYINDRILPMMRVLSSIDQATLETHFGDVLYFARNAQDRLWRVEAVFSLARYRFNAAVLGDQRTAISALKEIAQNEVDPIVRMAATVARDTTIEEYRMLK